MARAKAACGSCGRTLKSPRIPDGWTFRWATGLLCDRCQPEAVLSTLVIHVSEMHHFPGSVYVGRPMPQRGFPDGPFGNPYKVGDPGIISAIDSYRVYITQGAGWHLLANLPALRGKGLACWCRRDGVSPEIGGLCHADVLVKLLDQYTDEELRAMASAR